MKFSLSLQRTVTGVDFGVNLHPAVFRYHVFWDWHAFVDRDALLDYRVMFHTVVVRVLSVTFYLLPCRSFI